MERKKFLGIIVLAVVLSASISSCTGNQPSSVITSIDYETSGYHWGLVSLFNEMKFVPIDPANAWAFTSFEGISKYDGTDWSDHFNLKPGYISDYIVYAADANHIWATIEQENTDSAVYFYNGNDWSLQLETEDVLYRDYGFEGMTGIDPEHVWAYGYTFSDIDRNNHGCIYFYNGDSWNRQLICDAGFDISDIKIVDKEHAWALATKYVYSTDERQSSIYFFDGTSWVRQYETATTLSGLYAADASNIWTSGLDGEILSYNGETFVQQFIVEDKYEWPVVYPFDAEHAWATDSSGGIYFFDGTSWGKQYDTGRKLTELTVLDGGHVWGIDGGNEFEKTPQENRIYFFNGTDWSIQFEPGVELSDLEALDKENVWATGSSGFVYFYDGASWGTQCTIKGVWLQEIFPIDIDHIWIVGEGSLFLGTK